MIRCGLLLFAGAILRWATDSASTRSRCIFRKRPFGFQAARGQRLPARISSAPGGPAFLVTAGDLTMNGSQFEWDMYDYIRRAFHIPVYEGFGGHDGNCLDPRCTVSFEQRIGPLYYSWNYGGVHFIQLVTETGYLQTPEKIRQIEWITADPKSLAPGPLTHGKRHPLVVLAYDLALLVKSVACNWTSPSGKSVNVPLTQQGDWTWHGSFKPLEKGDWQCSLTATDVTGQPWKRS